MKTDLIELAKALGYVGGEIHEITKDGVGVEDFGSVVDIATNFDILAKGFKFEVKPTKEDLAKLGQEELVEVVMALFSGYNKGKE